MVQPQRPLSNEGNPGAAQNTAIQVADAPVKEKGGNQRRAEKAKAKVKGKGKGKGKGKRGREVESDSKSDSEGYQTDSER